MNKEQALEILAEAINKAVGVYNKSELFAIQQAFSKLQEKNEPNTTTIKD
jgi:enolase